MDKVIELKDKQDNGEGKLSLIAECNGYVNGQLVQQFSRSPFVFDSFLTDQEIINYLWDNEYKIYL